MTLEQLRQEIRDTPASDSDALRRWLEPAGVDIPEKWRAVVVSAVVSMRTDTNE